jgi:hypothetical protein
MKNPKNAPRARRAFVRALLYAFLFVLVLGPFSAAQTNISGLWVLRTPTGDGNFRELFLDLKQEGEQGRMKPSKIGKRHGRKDFAYRHLFGLPARTKPNQAAGATVTAQGGDRMAAM